MKFLLLVSIPIALLVAFGGGVLFWAAASQVRFHSYFKYRDDRPPPLGFSGWVAFYFRTLTGAYTLLWWSIRGAFQAGLRQPPGSVTGRPVLCIHGLFMNSSCMWGIRRHLEHLGRPTRAIFMGIPLPTPMAYAEPLAHRMQQMADEFSKDGFDIVAHSIGGVMTREVLHRHPELADHVHQIVTLGSPHHGTAAVRWIKFGPIYGMLSLQSRYLKDLGDFRTLAPGIEVTTVAALHDLIVYPSSVCHLEGTHPSDLVKISHLGLMTETRVFLELEEALGGSNPQVG